MKIASSVAMIGALLFGAQAHAGGDAAAGKTAFANQCASCHTVEAGKNGFGPSLAGVVGRHSGSIAGYNYSAAMANAGLTWDAANIDKFIANSTAFVPGTSMPVQVADATTRENIVAYLATLGAPAAVATAEPAPKPPAPLPAGPTSEELLKSATDTQGWLYASKDYAGQRFVALDQITAANAHSLRASCIYRAATTGSFQSSPLVYKGTMYFTVDNVTIAIDAATCREKWVNTWKMEGSPLSKSNRGGAIADGLMCLAARKIDAGYVLVPVLPFPDRNCLVECARGAPRIALHLDPSGDERQVAESALAEAGRLDGRQLGACSGNRIRRLRNASEVEQGERTPSPGIRHVHRVLLIPPDALCGVEEGQAQPRPPGTHRIRARLEIGEIHPPRLGIELIELL